MKKILCALLAAVFLFSCAPLFAAAENQMIETEQTAVSDKEENPDLSADSILTKEQTDIFHEGPPDSENLQQGQGTSPVILKNGITEEKNVLLSDNEGGMMDPLSQEDDDPEECDDSEDPDDTDESDDSEEKDDLKKKSDEKPSNGADNQKASQKENADENPAPDQESSSKGESDDPNSQGSSEPDPEDQDDREEGPDPEGNNQNLISQISMQRPGAPTPNSFANLYYASLGEGVYAAGIWKLNGQPVIYFHPGNTYVLHVSINLNQGYGFAEDVSLLVDGVPADFSRGSDSLKLTFSYHLGPQEPEKPTITEITDWQWTDGSGSLELPYAETGYSFETVCSHLPSSITAGDESIPLAGWFCSDYMSGPEGWPKEGSYTFTAKLPEGYVLAEGAKALTVSVRLLEAPKEPSYEFIPESAPGCDTPGRKAHYVDEAGNFYLEVDGEMKPSTEDALRLEPLGHRWGQTTYHFSEDGKTCTAERSCLNNPDHREAVSGEITTDILKAPDCDHYGATKYKAEFSVFWAEPQEKVIEDLAPLGHDWSETIYHFSEDGKICTAERHCLRNPDHQEEISAEVTSEVLKAPGCESYGATKYRAVFSASWAETQEKTIEDLAPLGHDWSETIYHFSEDGKTCTAERHCLRNPDHQEEISAEVTSEVLKAPGCESYGATKYRAVFSAFWAENQEKTIEDLAPLGHDWGETSYYFSADGKYCTAQRVCMRNSDHKQKIQAVISKRVTKQAGCESNGETTYQAVFSESWAQTQRKVISDIAPLGHQWGNTEYIWSPDGSSCQAVRTCLHDPLHKETCEAAVTFEITREPTETAKGQTTYRAVFREEFAKTQENVLTNIEKLPPMDEEGRIEGSPISSEDGEPGLKASISVDYLRTFCEKALENGDTEGICFACGPVSVNYDLAALTAILQQAENAEKISVSIEHRDSDWGLLTKQQSEKINSIHSGKLYGVELMAESAESSWEIHDFKGGNSKITLPYQRNEGFRISAYRVEEDGTLSEVPCRYDDSTGSITFETPSHSHYIVTPKWQDLAAAWILTGMLVVLLVVVMFINRKGVFDLILVR